MSGFIERLEKLNETDTKVRAVLRGVLPLSRVIFQRPIPL